MSFANLSDNDIQQLYKSISSKVRFKREQKEVSQLELSLEIGIKSVAFYSNCENNKNGKHFNLEHLYKISKALDINICELI